MRDVAQEIVDRENAEHQRQLDANRRWREKNRAYDNSRNKIYRAKNPGKRNASSRKTWLKLSYGLTLAQYDQMLADQGGVCKICGTAKAGNNRRFCVDHVVETGEIRGLLCIKCNVAVGNHDVEFLLRCATYVATKGKLQPTVS